MSPDNRISKGNVFRHAPAAVASFLIILATVALATPLVLSSSQSYAATSADGRMGDSNDADGFAVTTGTPSSTSGSPVMAQSVITVRTEGELREAIKAGGVKEIDLGADITLTNSSIEIPMDSQVTITSSGNHTLTGASQSYYVFYMLSGSKLTLGSGLVLDGAGTAFVNNSAKGSFVLDGATLTHGGARSGYECIRVSGDGSTFEFKSGTIKECTLTSGGIVSVESNATMVMSGGTITGCTVGGPDAGRAATVSVMTSATFEMEAGEITGNKVPGGGFTLSAHGVLVYQATFNMRGGAIRDNGAGYNLQGSSLVSGGIAAREATVTLSGGKVSGNRGVYGGGALLHNSSSLITGNASISGNTAKFGGGVYVYQSGIGTSSLTMNGGSVSSNTASSWGGGVYAGQNSTFTFDGGSIKENTADSGGGVYVGSTTEVYLNAGYIEGNMAKRTAYGTGGGITVASNKGTSYQGFHMKDALITGNSAGTIGGGAWLCPTGELDSEISDGVAMYDNEAAHAGDDLAVVISGITHSSDVIQSRMLGGGIAQRYLDGTLSANGNLEYQGDGSGERYRNGRRDLFDYSDWHGDSSIALHNEASENAKELAEQRARLFIRNNTSDNAGGGIASNGDVWVGKAESKKVTVRKVWGLSDGSSALAEVRVKLEIDGAKDGVAREVEEVVLNAANNWTHTFEGIPVKAKVNLEEAEVTAPGWVSYYKEGFFDKKTISDPDSDESGTEQAAYYELETVDVTNAREGKLTIAKEIDGNLADPDQEFQFQVTILNPDDPLDQPVVDEQSEEQTAYKPYEGRDSQHHARLLDFDYSGSTSGTLVGGTGVITLKAGESVTVSGLPHGAWYRVREVASTADGYEIMPKRSDGAVGHAAETGNIAGDATTTLNYTNLKGDRMGSLKVSKAVGGDAADPDHLFHFQVRFYHPDGSELTEGEFAYMNSHEGVIGSGSMFALRGGESIHIDGIPADTRWEVKEVVVDAHGYEVESVRGDLRGEDAEEGVIESLKTAELAYTNVKESTMGTLAVSKTVASGDAGGEFEFELTFTDESGNDVRYGEFAYTGDREGFIESGDTLKLSSGQRVVIEGLPAGTAYQVREVNAEGYEATYEGAEGTIAPGGAAEAKVVNNLAGKPDRVRAKLPNSGDPAGNVAVLAVGACLLSALAAALAFMHRRRV